MFFMTLDQFRVSWEPPDVGEGQSARPMSAGSLVVTRNMEVQDDIERLVHNLLANGYTKIVIEKVNT